MKRTVIFLGHIVSNIHETSKVDEVVNFFTPSCTANVKAFLGMVSFFRKLIPSFSAYGACLFDPLKKGRTFVWSDECGKVLIILRLTLGILPC